jgi:hypothetical protein
LFPNPVDTRCMIIVPVIVEKVSTAVYNMTGVLIFTNKHRIAGSNQIELDASSLKAGQYLVRVMADRGTYTFKFIKK